MHILQNCDSICVMSNGNILEQAGQLVAGHVDFAIANDVVAYTGMLVPAALATGILAREYLKGSRPVHEGIIGGEQEGIEAMDSAPQNKVRSIIGRRATMLALTTAASFAVPAILGPNTTERVGIPGTEAVFLVDLSRTMTKTDDMANGQSRLDATSEAVSAVLPELPSDLRIGVVTFGESSDIATPLTSDKTSIQIPKSEQVSGQAYSEITDGINLAQNTLSGSDNPASDVMFILTDGTIDNPEAMNQALIESADTGTEIVVIATGTKEGSYKLTEYDPQPIASAVNPEVFADVTEHDNIKIFEATSAEQIQKIINKNIDKVATKEKENPFTLFRNIVIGSGVLAYLTESLKAIMGTKRKSNRKQ